MAPDRARINKMRKDAPVQQPEVQRLLAFLRPRGARTHLAEQLADGARIRSWMQRAERAREAFLTIRGQAGASRRPPCAFREGAEWLRCLAEGAVILSDLHDHKPLPKPPHALPEAEVTVHHALVRLLIGLPVETRGAPPVSTLEAWRDFRDWQICEWDAYKAAFEDSGPDPEVSARAIEELGPRPAAEPSAEEAQNLFARWTDEEAAALAAELGHRGGEAFVRNARRAAPRASEEQARFRTLIAEVAQVLDYADTPDLGAPPWKRRPCGRPGFFSCHAPGSPEAIATEAEEPPAGCTPPPERTPINNWLEPRPRVNAEWVMATLWPRLPQRRGPGRPPRG